MFGVVGVIPPVADVKQGCPTQLKFSRDGRRLYYGVQTGVVCRLLPEPFDMDYEHEQVSVLYGVKKNVSAVAISPDDVFVAGGDTDGNVYIWKKTKADIELAVYNLEMPYVRISDLDFSEDSQKLAVGGVDKYGKKLATCIIAEGGLPVGNLEGHTLGVNSLSFRAQKPSRVATGGVDGKLCLHEGPPFKLKNSSDDAGSSPLTCVRYSPNGEFLATTGVDGRVILWHPLNGEIDRIMDVSDLPLTSIAWHPESSHFAVFGNDRMLRIFDTHNSEVLTECDLTRHAGKEVEGVSVCWSPTSTNWIVVLISDGRMLGFKWDEEIKELTDDAPEFQWIGPRGYPSVLDFYRPMNRVLLGTSLGLVMFLKQESDTLPILAKTIAENRVTVRGILQTSDCVMVVTIDGVIREAKLSGKLTDSVNEKNDEEETKTLVKQITHLSDYQSPSEELDDAVEIIHSYKFGETPKVVVAMEGNKYCLVVTREGKLLVFPFGTPHSSLDPVWEDRLPAQSVVAAEVSSDGLLLAIAIEAAADYPLDRFEDERTALSNMHLIELYEIDDLSSAAGIRFVGVLEWHNKPITAMSLSSDGCLLASVDQSRAIHVTDINTKSLLTQPLTSHKTKVNCLAWSPDGRHLASGSVDSNIYIWDPENPTNVLTADMVHRSAVTQIKFLLNNIFLSTSVDGISAVTEIWYE